MYAAARYLERGIVSDLPPTVLERRGSMTTLGMSAVVAADAAWALAQGGLDLLGTILADERPYGGMRLLAPIELESGEMLLHLEVGVPADALAELEPRLRFAFEALLLDYVEPEAIHVLLVEPWEASDGS